MSDVISGTGDPETIAIMRTQAIKLVALSVMLRDGDLAIRGDDSAAAEEAIRDLGEECALHLGGL